MKKTIVAIAVTLGITRSLSSCVVVVPHGHYHHHYHHYGYR